MKTSRIIILTFLIILCLPFSADAQAPTVTPQPVFGQNNWWNDSLDDYWKASQSAQASNNAQEIWLQNETQDPFGMLPEITPDFSWGNSSDPDGYVGWFWYPEDDTSQNYNYDNNQFMPYTGTFGDLSGAWKSDVEIPSSAIIDGFVGNPQSYNLDCETRSAVDWATYFGFTIDAFEFLTNLPKSDDPNEGFVGNYWDERGQLPPSGYGVYQEPVAALLRSYGVPAVGYKNTTWEQVKYEIASGRPVIVWVAGNTEVATAQYYTPSNGNTTMVVPYQHTVVVLGYDTNTVTLQDGKMRYQRDLNTFLASWKTLENRAIIAVY